MAENRSSVDVEPLHGDRVENETDLIQTYLAPLAQPMPGAFGLRDDAALIANEPGSDLVVSTDPIIAGVHFLPTDAPADVAWKALAVNVSDVVAKGADPIAYLLTLALPDAPERAWMGDFAKGLRAAQDAFGCGLIGGDTDRTPGPLSIAVTIFGHVPSGRFVRRQGAQAGDHVFISGTIGDSALGLLLHRDPALFATVLTDEGRSELVIRYLQPRPRVELAETVRTHARAALDISDGLMKDLSRLTGDLGLTLKFGDIPLSPPLRAALEADERVRDAVLGGGDDYELLIAVPPDDVAGFRDGAAQAGVGIMDVGVLEKSGGLRVVDADGSPITPRRFGYDHFNV
ncbi:thiamine-phosphate kinase [Hyphomicrobium methylovorum]|uniref:thiamine-phosphate kinase n=1 Tax=Hyphomicrobium methylovorum TaxID=84 RepID=UPI0015E7612E|nr:thiamine-phosphate kinase [Hyphomicrobium methylovorum]MBA2127493.1 thiamine-phosphate kinase [Hyphomicrobium methylovorum]